jgi:hypothetical protein
LNRYFGTSFEKIFIEDTANIIGGEGRCISANPEVFRRRIDLQRLTKPILTTPVEIHEFLLGNILDQG